MNKYWNGLSERERTLFKLTGGTLALGLCFVLAFRAVGYVGDLDSRIDQLEQELVNLTVQNAQAESVEAAYRQVVAEHSTQRTKEEIHDDLRREIYRLALKRPGQVGLEDESRTYTSKDYMVQIPQLREGTLRDGGEGYREYEIRFRLPNLQLLQLLEFLRRLETSNQLLRIDACELARPPDKRALAVTLEVTRTVLDLDRDAIAFGDAAPTPRRGQDTKFASDFEFWESQVDYHPSWRAVGCELERSEVYATSGANAMKVVASAPEAQVYQRHTVRAGRTYRMELDVSSLAPGLLSVRDGEMVSFEGFQEIPANEKTVHYDTRFIAHGEEGERVDVLAPFIELGVAGDTLYIDNVRLTEVEE